VALIQPWATCGRAAAIDSTVLRAKGGVWHKKDRQDVEVRRIFHKLCSTAIENFNEQFKGERRQRTKDESLVFRPSSFVFW
jgi:hypothetical protein